MAKANKTFLKLSPDKQERLLRAAYLEFGEHDYSQASLSRLVKTLGIAKGSIYQYFNDKKGLYLYLLEQANRKRQQYVAEHLPKSAENFLTHFREIHYLGLRFDLSEPLYSAFLQKVAQERFFEDIGDLSARRRQHALAYYEKVLSKAEADKQLRPKLEHKVGAFVLMQVSSGLLDYLCDQYQINLVQAAQNGEDLRQKVSDDTLKKALRELLQILKLGFI